MRKMNDVEDFTAQLEDLFFQTRDGQVSPDKANTMTRAAAQLLRAHIGQMQYHQGQGRVVPLAFWERKKDK